jgi:hypothetical protein
MVRYWCGGFARCFVGLTVRCRREAASSSARNLLGAPAVLVQVRIAPHHPACVGYQISDFGTKLDSQPREVFTRPRVLFLSFEGSGKAGTSPLHTAGIPQPIPRDDSNRRRKHGTTGKDFPLSVPALVTATVLGQKEDS